MKTRVIFSILMILGALMMSACGITVVRGSGEVVTENRAVSNYDSVSFSCTGDLVITQGDTEGLIVEAEKDLMKYIRTFVRGRTLHIYLDPASMLFSHPQKPMRFQVAMKSVKGLDLSGSGTIYAEKVTTDDLDIDISGSGQTTIDDLTANSLSLDISGSGKSRMKGTVDRETIEISGSGTVNHEDLASKDVKVDVSGSGETFVNTSDTLDIDISGSGDVTYTGIPKVRQHISGSGDIISQ